MEKRIDIALCSTAYQFDYTRIFHRQALSLAKYFKVTIYGCAPFREKTFQENLRVIGLPPWQRKFDRIRNLFLLWRKLKRAKADIFIFHDTVGMLLIPWIKIFQRAKTVYDIHENFHGWIREKEWIPKPFRSLAAYSYILLERIVLNYTDMIWFAVSDIGEHYAFVATSKKMVVGNLPSLEQFNAIKQEVEGVKNQFIFVGSLDADRSITQIIRAFDLFWKDQQDYELILAGIFFSPRYQKEVLDLIASSGCRENIKLMEKVPYPQALRMIAESKIGLSLHQPTYNFLRGMPLKLLEYIGMGTPVIASNFENFRKIVDTADCGQCVDPNDVDKIAESMSFMVSDETRRRQMGENGKTQVENEYNWEKISLEIVSALRKLCSE